MIPHMANFTYTPLTSSTSIRVLTILPSELSGVISVDLLQVDLAYEPSYECLSYTWGKPGNEKAIHINGAVFPIRPNLFDFLTKLVTTGGQRRLWIDAICINQKDIDEKTIQVQMMSRIYSTATRVLAWMGEHADDSAQLFQPSWEPPPGERNGDINWKVDLSNTKNHLQQAESHRRLRIWYAFFRRAYWSRKWIIQEIVLAKSILIYCGDDLMDWEDLIARNFERRRAGDPLLWLRDGRKHENSFINRGNKVPLGYLMSRSLQKLRTGDESSWGFAVERDIIEVAFTFKDTSCSEPLDKVYALISLLQPEDIPPSLMADYSITIAELYVRVSLTIEPKTTGTSFDNHVNIKIRDLLRVFMADGGMPLSNVWDIADVVVREVEAAQQDPEKMHILMHVAGQIAYYLRDHEVSRTTARGISRFLPSSIREIITEHKVTAAMKGNNDVFRRLLDVAKPVQNEYRY